MAAGSLTRAQEFVSSETSNYFMPRVSFHTLGCKLNFAESSGMRRAFAQRAYTVVPFGEAADVVVINTCSVTAEAARKCRQVIRRGCRTSPDACVIVTGCYAQLQPAEVAAIEGVDVVLGTQEKARLFELVRSFEQREQTQIDVSCTGDIRAFDAALLSSERTRAFLKIQDGCDYSCAFCTIPIARGKSRSASPGQVLRQAHDIAARGIKEIVLTGVNIGLYGQGTYDTDGGAGLLGLLRQLSTVEGIERYRISSIEPNLLTDAIIDFVGSTPSFVPHFHIPLQSGDDAMLGAMRRRYRQHVFAGRVARIFQLMPDACVGADVIVGHPGETQQRFQNTYRFVQDLPVTYLHAFTYSERPGTVSATAAQHERVPKHIRSERNRVLRTLSNQKQVAFMDDHLGTSRPVLWERTRSNGHMYGFTDNYIRVRRPNDLERVGNIEAVRLERREDLVAVTS